MHPLPDRGAAARGAASGAAFRSTASRCATGRRTSPRFLAAYGDPFRTIGADTDRRVQIALGSAGVPETFVIDGRGIIRHQHIGPIMDADIPAIVAAYEEARR